jgi:uncharacterized membrane protein YcaP (DUF421 family)
MVATNNEVLKGSLNERLLTPMQIHKEYPTIVIEDGILEDQKLKNIKIRESEVNILSVL